MARKLTFKNPEYWSNVCVAFAQITFGVLWASIFLPLDKFKLFVILLNLIATIVLVIVGLLVKIK